ncbi:hypothetical protein F66182_1395 [Fusarium sp. NRRL 66182]|nr:hypothetical protein F66182_1395 [Fusarium sp. NRRL 66182]
MSKPMHKAPEDASVDEFEEIFEDVLKALEASKGFYIVSKKDLDGCSDQGPKTSSIASFGESLKRKIMAAFEAINPICNNVDSASESSSKDVAPEVKTDTVSKEEWEVTLEEACKASDESL